MLPYAACCGRSSWHPHEAPPVRRHRDPFGGDVDACRTRDGVPRRGGKDVDVIVALYVPCARAAKQASARRIGVLGPSTNPVFAKAMLDEVRPAGRATRLEIHPVVMILRRGSRNRVRDPGA